MKIGRKLVALFLTAVLLAAIPFTAFAAGATAISFASTSELKAELGKAYRRTAITTPKDAAVTYSSSNTKVATVDSSGRVTTVAVGKATITAKSGDISASYNVNVVAALTLEERINGLKLTPDYDIELMSPSNWYDFSRVKKIGNNKKLSNYEKMQAVFIDIAQQTKGFSCTSHASVLGDAYKMLGFKVYGASGGVKTKSGKPDASSEYMGFTEYGYTAHSWIAVEIDGTSKVVKYKGTGTVNGKPFEYEGLKIYGENVVVNTDINLKGEILFFDVNLYSTHGMNFDACFAVPPRNTALYTAVGVGAYYG